MLTSKNTLDKGKKEKKLEVNVKAKLFKPSPRMHIGGVEVWSHPFLTPAIDGGEWPNLGSGQLIPGKETWQPSNERIFYPQSRPGRFGEDKISCS